jgi:hypothetical protein
VDRAGGCFDSGIGEGDVGAHPIGWQKSPENIFCSRINLMLFWALHLNYVQYSICPTRFLDPRLFDGRFIHPTCWRPKAINLRGNRGTAFPASHLPDFGELSRVAKPSLRGDWVGNQSILAKVESASKIFLTAVPACPYVIPTLKKQRIRAIDIEACAFFLRWIDATMGVGSLMARAGSG